MPASRLPDILDARGVASPRQWSRAEARARDLGGHPALHLVAAGVDPAALVAALVHEGVALASEAALAEASPEAVASIPRELALTAGALPLEREGERLVVAFADPFDLEARRALEERSGLSVQPVGVDPRLLEKGLARWYGPGRVRPAAPPAFPVPPPPPPESDPVPELMRDLDIEIEVVEPAAGEVGRLFRSDAPEEIVDLVRRKPRPGAGPGPADRPSGEVRAPAPPPGFPDEVSLAAVSPPLGGPDPGAVAPGPAAPPAPEAVQDTASPPYPPPAAAPPVGADEAGFDERLRRIREARDRDELARAVVLAAVALLPRAVLFALRGGRLTGWAGAGMADPGRLTAFSTPADAGLLGYGLEMGPLEGPAERGEAADPLYEAVPPPPGYRVLLPIRIGGRALALLYADAPAVPLAPPPRLTWARLTDAAAEGLAGLLANRRPG